MLDHLSDKTREDKGASFDGTHSIIASSQTTLEAAAFYAKTHGIKVTVLGDDIEGESKDIGRSFAQQVLQENKRPHLYLSGGETTVTVKGTGRGGPNSEFLLSLALELNGAKSIFALACDTDGIDGSEGNAGAIIKPNTLIQAKKYGIDAQTCLKNNDAYSFFKTLGDLVETGPTYTLSLIHI